ncbi:hypothetical protein [Pseudomonas laurylsulfatiphila]|uniref:hypothetical protein n=1 Tax=Pseudomonas laurylsulfatiphila TaxID=2011015 RepID=UPI003D2347F0
MVVNDNACERDKRGALEPIAGKPAPTIFRDRLSIFGCSPSGQSPHPASSGQVISAGLSTSSGPLVELLAGR